jgi:hypothetical protein
LHIFAWSENHDCSCDVFISWLSPLLMHPSRLVAASKMERNYSPCDKANRKDQKRWKMRRIPVDKSW